MIKIGSLYKVKSEWVNLVDTKTNKQKRLQKNDIVTVIDFEGPTTDKPTVFVDNERYRLYFDWHYGDSFESFFDEVTNEI